jgi:hypothetical protein
MHIHALYDENHELKNKIMELESKLIEKTKYIREEVTPGFFAYVNKESTDSYQDTHKFCSNCYDKGIRSSLVSEKSYVEGTFNITCTECSKTFQSARYKKRGN